ncbi:unnamed protein product, partial [Prorocentrum cordatum]
MVKMAKREASRSKNGRDSLAGVRRRAAISAANGGEEGASSDTWGGILTSPEEVERLDELMIAEEMPEDEKSLCNQGLLPLGTFLQRWMGKKAVENNELLEQRQRKLKEFVDTHGSADPRAPAPPPKPPPRASRPPPAKLSSAPELDRGLILAAGGRAPAKPPPPPLPPCVAELAPKRYAEPGMAMSEMQETLSSAASA